MVSSSMVLHKRYQISRLFIYGIVARRQDYGFNGNELSNSTVLNLFA